MKRKKEEISETSKFEHINKEQLSDEDFTKLLSQMQENLERLEKDAEESHTRYLRALADFDNFRKRQREDVSRQIAYAKEEMILKILAIYDNFSRAAASAENDGSFENLLEGVKMVIRQIDDFFIKEGVEAIQAIGEQFDPETHEALMRLETQEYEPNTIIEEFEKGYVLNGKVLRPSKVQVSG